MKVAICFSGLPRLDSPISIKKWQYYINLYNADVFVHTWVLDESEKNDTIDKIVSYFKPKIFKLEKSRDYPLHEYKHRVWPNLVPYNVFSAFAGIYECMELVNKYSTANKFEYDYVIRARFDIFVDNLTLDPINGIAVIDDPSKHCLKFRYRGLDLFGISDIFAYGSQQNMNLYSNVSNHIHTLYHGEGVDMCSELLLTSNLVRQGVSISFQPIQAVLVRR